MFLQYEQEVQFCDCADINSVCDLHCIEVGWGCYPTKYCGNNILFSPYSPTLHIKWYASYSKVKSMYTSLRQLVVTKALLV